MSKNSEMSITKKMLSKLRENRDRQAAEAASQFIVEEKENDNFLTRSKVLMNEAVESSKKKINEADERADVDAAHKDYFTIKKNTPQFGDVRVSQEDTIKKTITTSINFGEEALRYYPEADDMTLDGKIPSLNMKFQFRYNDPSGVGSYLWVDALQLTDENVKTIGKLKAAFENWKDSITQDGDLMERLKKASKAD